MAFVEPVTLRGTHVMLEPLAREHEAGLKAAAADGELWQLWYTSVPTLDKTLEWIDAALRCVRSWGNAVRRARAVERRHRRLHALFQRRPSAPPPEIGTRYAKRVQRTRSIPRRSSCC
jgi:alkanesulfonate monooxygenase SsuD/methylene tetrahydromethanopterin reductase-like flavin-dependent oxidoreductase (luciferase family)